MRRLAYRTVPINPKTGPEMLQIDTGLTVAIMSGSDFPLSVERQDLTADGPLRTPTSSMKF